MPLTNDQVNEIIDQENGDGFCFNIDKSKCYRFNRGNSFAIFRIQTIENVKVCHIRYIHFENEAELATIMAFMMNFLEGNKVMLIVYREKNRKNKKKSPIPFMKDVGFNVSSNDDYTWQYTFNCNIDGSDCHCKTYEVVK